MKSIFKKLFLPAGFTAEEVINVVVIISVLFLILIPRFLNRMEVVRIAPANKEIARMADAESPGYITVYKKGLQYILQPIDETSFAPTAGFYGIPTSGNGPLIVIFTDTSAFSPTSWSWNFGDGSTSNLQNPSHIYAVVTAPTSYTVQLVASNSFGASTATLVNYISVTQLGPIGGFFGTPTSGNGPLTVNFTDTSAFNPTSWQWSFGDGSTSNIQYPSHTYNTVSSPTSYKVQLIVANAFGVSTVTNTNYISVTEPAPSAGFYATPTIGIGVFSVNFTDTSANFPASWTWNFGDGNTSNVQDPSHSYNNVSASTSYTVQLIASNAFGVSSISQSSYIYVLDSADGQNPILANVPSLKLFMGQTFNNAFNLEDYNSGGIGSSYSIPIDFLELGSLSGSTVNQNMYSAATTGSDVYQINRLLSSSSSGNEVKYSTYKIYKLPHVGLTPGSSFDLNVGNYTYNSTGLAIPPSFGNPTALNISNLFNVTAHWVNDSVVQITSLQPFTGAVDVDVTASPNAIAPFGSDVDVEQIQVYSNLLSNSTFSTANDTATFNWGALEYAPNRTVLATQSWMSSYTDSAGTQANGVWQFYFIDSTAGVKATPSVSNWINIANGQWYTFRIRLVADSTNNSHLAILFGYTNYPGSGTQTDIVGNVLFGVPTVWTWQEAPLLAHGNSTTGYPQFQFKAGGAGSIYVDEVQIIYAAPELVEARSNTRFHYLYGQFTVGTDTTGWGQELYPNAGSAPEISVNNGLVLNFAGATSGSGQEGIKWTANNGAQGPNAYSFPDNVNREVGVQLTLSIESGNFDTLGIVLAAAYGVQTAGDQSFDNIIAVADVGVLVSGNYYAIGNAVNSYAQGQFGLRSDAPGVLTVSNVDINVDNDDPNFGDPTLFP
jgi:PKD repeat protein